MKCIHDLYCVSLSAQIHIVTIMYAREHLLMLEQIFLPDASSPLSHILLLSAGMEGLLKLHTKTLWPVGVCHYCSIQIAFSSFSA